MSRCSWPLFFAGFCIFAYSCSIVYVVYCACIAGVDPTITSGEVEDPDAIFEIEIDEMITNTKAFGYACDFIGEFSMLIASILLFIGVKKQNYKFIVPWLWMSIIALIIFAFNIVSEDSVKGIISHVITILIVLAFWYPIYKHYKQLRYPKTTVTEHKEHKCCCPSNVHNVAHPHTTEFVHASYSTATAPTEMC